MELSATATAPTHSAGPRPRCAHCGNRNQLLPLKSSALARTGRTLVGQHPGYTHGARSRVCRFLLHRGRRYTLSDVYHRCVTPNANVSCDAGVLTSTAQPCSFAGPTEPGGPLCYTG